MSAEFLGVGIGTFRSLCRKNSHMLKPFNYTANGDWKWSQETLVRFRRSCEATGVQR